MEDFFCFFTERQKEVYRLREQKMTFLQIVNTWNLSKCCTLALSERTAQD